MSILSKSIGVLSIIILFVLIFGSYIKSYEGMTASADPTERQIATAIQNSAPQLARSISSIKSAMQSAAPGIEQAYRSASPVIQNIMQAGTTPNIQPVVSSSPLQPIPPPTQTTVTSYGNSGTPINNVKSYNF